MIELLEIARVASGTLLAVVALALAWVTFRSWSSGRSAYEANRRITHLSVGKTLLGQMKNGEGHYKNRANQGLSIDLSTGKLLPQQRLSEEAIDDVIGRRA